MIIFNIFHVRVLAEFMKDIEYEHNLSFLLVKVL
jgi:hypothetical protein